MSTLNMFLQGALAMAALVAAMFFLRFWRTSAERLFLFFAAAFALLAADWTALALVHPAATARHYTFVLRLIAFLLIIAGVVGKNFGRRGPR